MEYLVLIHFLFSILLHFLFLLLHTMADEFVITATYKNQERNFDAALIAYGYSYRIEVMVDEVKVIFEPDEERNYRAYLPDAANAKSLPDPVLLQAVATALEKAFR